MFKETLKKIGHSHYFSGSYWLGNPVPASGLGKFNEIVFILTALCLIAAIVFWFAGRTTRKNLLKRDLLGRWFTATITIAILSLVWLGFSYELAPYISGRWLAAVIYIVGIVWLVKIWRYLRGPYRLLKYQTQQDMQRSKYL